MLALAFALGAQIGHGQSAERACDARWRACTADREVLRKQLDACYERVEDREERIDKLEHDGIDDVLDEAP